MRRHHLFLVVLLLLCVPVWAQRGTGSNAQPEGGGAMSPLAPRQQRVNRMMGDMERMFVSLAQTLEETEPDRANRLLRAFQQSKELLFAQRMEKIVHLLNSASLDTASDEQQKIIEDLGKLMGVLMDDVDSGKLEKKIEKLERWRGVVQQLLKEEKKHLRDSERLGNKDKTLADLEHQIKAVKELIRRQEQLISKTADLDPPPMHKLGSVQGVIRQDTLSLAEQIAAAGAHSDSPQTGSQTGSQPQTGVGSSSGSRSSEPGEQPLREAAGHQQSAERQLQDSNPQAAQTEEEKSVDDLKKALAELEKERERLQSPPSEVFPEIADKQDVTAKAAEQLGGEMAGASKSGNQSGGGQPCQQQVANASQCMRQASGQLRNRQPGPASKEQGKAIAKLERALGEIERQLAGLGEQMQDELLIQLEEIFREMLDQQRQASAGTIKLDERERESDGNLRRADRLALKKLAQEERELAEMAQHALDLLTEDGTSIVFPAVVADLRDNLQTVAELFDDQRTNDYTRSLQKEIETTLEELIDALQKGAGGGGKGGEKGGKKGGGSGCSPPLVSNTAELKLLRALQLRVNRRTKAFDKARPERLDEVMKTDIGNITGLQGEISHMVERIIERTQ